MISLEKWYILTTLQKLPKNDGDLGQSIGAKGFKKLPKVQNIAQSDHTDQLDQGLKPYPRTSLVNKKSLQKNIPLNQV